MLYQELADNIRLQIDNGLYQAGDRLRSVRELARERQVSLSTVVQAYQQLEAQGVIEARPQSGFYVRAKTIMPPTRLPKPRAKPMLVTKGMQIMQMVAAANDQRLLSLGCASPSLELLPSKALQRHLVAAAREQPDNLSRYFSLLGNYELRQQIARLTEHAGVTVTPDDIVITNGCQEALSLALRAIARPGDVIAVESPTYYGILQAIEGEGMRALEIPTDVRTGISLEALKFALDQWPVKAVVAMPTHSNPLGATMPETNKSALVSMLAERGIALIEDDVHAEFTATQRPPAAKHYDRHDGVLLCSSLSKTLAPGYRVGWIIAGQYQDRVAHLKYVSSLASPGITQLAAARYLASGSYERHVRELRRTYIKQLHQLSEAVTRYFPSGTKASMPDGGMILWLELPQKISGTKLYERALERGIAIVPGTLFSTQNKYEHFVRLSCGALWTQRSENAVKVLGELAHAMVGEQQEKRSAAIS